MTVARLAACDLVVTGGAWRYAEENAAAIALHWQAARADNSKLFDGDVFVIDSWAIAGGVLAGRALRAKFSQYLFWRSCGFDGGATHEAFATTVIVAADGGVLLARAVAGTVNDGKYVSAGGFLDGRDVVQGGKLDPAAAAGRELIEETGLDVRRLQRDNGFLLARDGPFLAVASVFRYPGTGRELVATVERFLSVQLEPELEDPCVIYRTAEIDALTATPFARLLAASQLA